jgi:uncharacterized protein (DUF362 family)
MQAIGPYLATLAGQAHTAGGWGYVGGQPAQLEPTCHALLALSLEAETYQPHIEAGLAALEAHRSADGGYRPAQGREEAVWPTALVLFVKAVLGRPTEEIRALAARLLGINGRIPGDDPEIARTLDIDCKLVGWPWAHGNFSWVEPTAWACLALRRAGLGDHARVEEGQRLLLDRALDDGGINYGSRRVFGRTTEPIPTPTAYMLLALQGHGRRPEVAAALRYLKRQAVHAEDLEHLCWTRIVMATYADEAVSQEVEDEPPLTPQELVDRIVQAYRARQTLGWARPAPIREALTALALGIGRHNPFRLAGIAPVGEHVAARPFVQRRRPLGERIRSRIRSIAVEAAGHLRPLPLETAVHIARPGSYSADLADVLQRQYESFRAEVPLTGKRVVLKPNLVEYHRDRVINTHPQVVAAAIELCQREGAAEVIVAEGPGHWRNTEYLVQASGLGDVLRHYRVPFVDLNLDEPVRRLNLGRCTGLEFLWQARTVVAADVLISLPKLKTHHWVGVTLSLKNLFGTMPGTCYGWPKNELHWRGIENSIVDIALTRPPDLAIVDGIVAMEGDGPLNGTPKAMGLLIMGRDPLAVDATACRLMQLDPQRVGYLALAARKRLGLIREQQIRQIGENVRDLAQPFETLERFQPLRLVPA